MGDTQFYESINIRRADNPVTDYGKLKRRTLKKERDPFRKTVKLHCRKNKIKNKDIAKAIGINEREFVNLMSGYQETAPTKGIESFEIFQKKICDYLCITLP